MDQNPNDAPALTLNESRICIMFLKIVLVKIVKKDKNSKSCHIYFRDLVCVGLVGIAARTEKILRCAEFAPIDLEQSSF